MLTENKIKSTIKNDIRDLCDESYYRGSIDSAEIIKQTLFLLKANGQEYRIISIIDNHIKEFNDKLEKLKNKSF